MSYKGPYFGLLDDILKVAAYGNKTCIAEDVFGWRCRPGFIDSLICNASCIYSISRANHYRSFGDMLK